MLVNNMDINKNVGGYISELTLSLGTYERLRGYISETNYYK